MTWVGQTASHVFQVVQASPEPHALGDVAPSPDQILDDFMPLPADGAKRIAATAVGSWPPADGGVTGVERSSIAAGVLVHRALEAGSDDLEPLLRDDERALIDDLPALLAHAGAALASIRPQPEIAEIFGEGASMASRKHEVPFSWRSKDGTIVRGTFDCLVERASGEILVLEFKTGRPAAEHQRQLAVDVAAAQALFPGRIVYGCLIYSRHSETTFDESVRLS